MVVSGLWTVELFACVEIVAILHLWVFVIFVNISV